MQNVRLSKRIGHTIMFLLEQKTGVPKLLRTLQGQLHLDGEIVRWRTVCGQPATVWQRQWASCKNHWSEEWFLDRDVRDVANGLYISSSGCNYWYIYKSNLNWMASGTHSYFVLHNSVAGMRLVRGGHGDGGLIHKWLVNCRHASYFQIA